MALHEDDADRLRMIEAQRLRSLVRADLASARALHADDYQLITPGGVTYSKQEYLDGIAKGQLDYRVFEAASEVRVLMGIDLACLRYRAGIEIRLPEGSDSGVFWHTDVYRRRGDDWLATWSQATRISG